MAGSAMSLLGYLLLLLLLTLWIVVKIWKRSPALAILSFLFWPVTLVALITNWGDEESDIRVPFFLSLVVAGLMAFTALRTVEQGVQEMAYALSDEDIAEIRRDDPDLAAQLEAARTEQLAQMEADGITFDGDDIGNVESDGGTASGSEAWPEGDKVVAAPPAARDPAAVEAEFRANLERAPAHLSWQFGRVALPAGAELQLPRHFRFATRSTLLQLARLRGTSLPADVVGWVVHRDVNLAREDAWYVQVRYVPLQTPPAPPEALAVAAERDAAVADYVAGLAGLVGAQSAGARAPAWDAKTGVATWQRGDASSAFADHVAARVLPGGVLESSVPALHAAHADLGTRAARMVAQRVTVAPAAR